MTIQSYTNTLYMKGQKAAKKQKYGIATILESIAWE